MRTLAFNYGVSKGKTTDGLATCNVYEHGRRIASAKGTGDLRAECLIAVLERDYGERFSSTLRPSTFDGVQAIAARGGLLLDIMASGSSRDMVTVRDTQLDALAA